MDFLRLFKKKEKEVQEWRPSHRYTVQLLCIGHGFHRVFATGGWAVVNEDLLVEVVPQDDLTEVKWYYAAKLVEINDCSKG